MNTPPEQVPTPYPNPASRDPGDAERHIELACHWLGLGEDKPAPTPTAEQARYALEHLRLAASAAEQDAIRSEAYFKALRDIGKYFCPRIPEPLSTELQTALWQVMAGGSIEPSKTAEDPA